MLYKVNRETQTQKPINTLEKTIMKSDSGRDHVRRMIGIFLYFFKYFYQVSSLVITVHSIWHSKAVIFAVN